MPKITPDEARALMVQDIEPAMETIYQKIRVEAAKSEIDVTIYDSSIVGNRHKLGTIRSRLFREGYLPDVHTATDQRDQDSLNISWRQPSQDDR